MTDQASQPANGNKALILPTADDLECEVALAQNTHDWTQWLLSKLEQGDATGEDIANALSNINGNQMQLVESHRNLVAAISGMSAALEKAIEQRDEALMLAEQQEEQAADAYHEGLSDGYDEAVNDALSDYAVVSERLREVLVNDAELLAESLRNQGDEAKAAQVEEATRAVLQQLSAVEELQDAAFDEVYTPISAEQAAHMAAMELEAEDDEDDDPPFQMTIRPDAKRLHEQEQETEADN